MYPVGKDNGVPTILPVVASVNVTPVIVALSNVVPDKETPVKFTFVKLQPVKSQSMKSSGSSEKFAPLRFTPGPTIHLPTILYPVGKEDGVPTISPVIASVNVTPVISAFVRFTPEKYNPVIFAFVKFAPDISTPTMSAPDKSAPDKSDSDNEMVVKSAPRRSAPSATISGPIIQLLYKTYALDGNVVFTLDANGPVVVFDKVAPVIFTLSRFTPDRFSPVKLALIKLLLFNFIPVSTLN